MSDHISGPRALAEPIADITDMYAFTSPGSPGRLVLVMNTLPFARHVDRFSPDLIYRFRLRPISLAGPDDPSPFIVGDSEWVVDCTFSTPEPQDGAESPRQHGVCTTTTGKTVPFKVDDLDGGEADGIRVFAGPRWDPFIMDAPAALKTIATGKLSFSESGSIYLDGKNVLSVVVELPCADLLDDGQLVGVIGETLTRGGITVRLERVGRPEMKNLLLGPKQFDTLNRDLEIRDLYNMEDAFHLAETYEHAYRARLNANLAFWDGLDGKLDWPVTDDGTHPLTELLLADFLIVDPRKPYSEHGSFFEIELAQRAARAHSTCGGRSLNDDVMDTLYTLWITGGQGPAIRDGVDSATKPASSAFPYVVPPNLDPPQRPDLP